MAELPELDYRAYDFCRRQTTHDIATHHLSRFWTHTVLAACHDDPAILHSMLALSGAHRFYCDAQAGLVSLRAAETAMYSHYGKAVRLLQDRMRAKSLAECQTILIVCLVLLTFDVIQGRYREALVHLNHGRRILRGLQACKSEVSGMTGLYLPVKAESTLDELSYSFAIMDLQSVTFGSEVLQFRLMGDQDEVDPGTHRIPTSFANLDEAWRCILLLLNEVHYFAISLSQRQSIGSTDDQSLRIWQGRVLGYLRQWKKAFDNGPLRTAASGSSSSSAWHDRSAQLRLTHTYLTVIVRVLLNRDDEMVYDSLISEYSKMIALCEELAGRLPSIKLDAVVIPALYYVGGRCRHPGLRRRVLQALSRVGREGHWDGRQIERLTREKMRIEEEGSGYMHNENNDVPEDGGLLAAIVPLHARWTELWADFSDEDYTMIRLQFKRRVPSADGGTRMEVRHELVRC
ncbi:hypothetical protein B0A52_09868 [Exophiala mesophila]|uniref:Uncharacterized protein n=1 Tax=Exophiala mesophila TaxID=212818 RepID=A0A438MR96_EXOME|nr:hypothetical protein B0A52_09868 [Exophiala mesophila]